MNKTYIEPKFTFVRIDESNKVFFAASGTSGAPSGPSGTAVSGNFTQMTSENGAW